MPYAPLLYLCIIKMLPTANHFGTGTRELRLRSGFLNLRTTDICFSLNNKPSYEGCPTHCRMFNSIPGLHALDASSTLPVVAIKIYIRHCQMSPGKENCPWLRITDLDKLGMTKKESLGGICGNKTI